MRSSGTSLTAARAVGQEDTTISYTSSSSLSSLDLRTPEEGDGLRSDGSAYPHRFSRGPLAAASEERDVITHAFTPSSSAPSSQLSSPSSLMRAPPQEDRRRLSSAHSAGNGDLPSWQEGICEEGKRIRNPSSVAAGGPSSSQQLGEWRVAHKQESSSSNSGINHKAANINGDVLGLHELKERQESGPMWRVATRELERSEHSVPVSSVVSIATAGTTVAALYSTVETAEADAHSACTSAVSSLAIWQRQQTAVPSESAFSRTDSRRVVSAAVPSLVVEDAVSGPLRDVFLTGPVRSFDLALGSAGPSSCCCGGGEADAWEEDACTPPSSSSNRHAKYHGGDDAHGGAQHQQQSRREGSNSYSYSSGHEIVPMAKAEQYEDDDDDDDDVNSSNPPPLAPIPNVTVTPVLTHRAGTAAAAAAAASWQTTSTDDLLNFPFTHGRNEEDGGCDVEEVSVTLENEEGRALFASDVLHPRKPLDTFAQDNEADDKDEFPRCTGINNTKRSSDGSSGQSERGSGSSGTVSKEEERQVYREITQKSRTSGREGEGERRDGEGPSATEARHARGDRPRLPRRRSPGSSHDDSADVAGVAQPGRSVGKHTGEVLVVAGTLREPSARTDGKKRQEVLLSPERDQPQRHAETRTGQSYHHHHHHHHINNNNDHRDLQLHLQADTPSPLRHTRSVMSSPLVSPPHERVLLSPSNDEGKEQRDGHGERLRGTRHDRHPLSAPNPKRPLSFADDEEEEQDEGGNRAVVRGVSNRNALRQRDDEGSGVRTEGRMSAVDINSAQEAELSAFTRSTFVSVDGSNSGGGTARLSLRLSHVATPLGADADADDVVVNSALRRVPTSVSAKKAPNARFSLDEALGVRSSEAPRVLGNTAPFLRGQQQQQQLSIFNPPQVQGRESYTCSSQASRPVASTPSPSLPQHYTTAEHRSAAFDSDDFFPNQQKQQQRHLLLERDPALFNVLLGVRTFATDALEAHASHHMKTATSPRPSHARWTDGSSRGMDNNKQQQREKKTDELFVASPERERMLLRLARSPGGKMVSGEETAAAREKDPRLTSVRDTLKASAATSAATRSGAFVTYVRPGQPHGNGGGGSVSALDSRHTSALASSKMARFLTPAGSDHCDRSMNAVGIGLNGTPRCAALHSADNYDGLSPVPHHHSTSMDFSAGGMWDDVRVAAVPSTSPCSLAGELTQLSLDVETLLRKHDL